MLNDLKFRLRALFRRGEMERELEEELRFHLERETEKHVRAGVPRVEAERRARLAFGGLDRIKDDVRDTRGISALERLLQDLRYAWRGLRARPGFSAAIVVTLALGIGANTALFGIVDRMLFRPPAYLEQPERTHRVFTSIVWDGRELVNRSFAYARYDDFRELTTSFDRLAAFAFRDVAIGTGDAAREMTVGLVSASYFDFFDARPVLGRFFGVDEDRAPVGGLVTVVSHAFWQSHYGGRRDVLGERLHVGSQVYTVIGVAPEGFVGTAEGAAPVAFVPITAAGSTRSPDYHESYDWSWLEILARRKADVSLAAANADLTTAFRRSWTREAEIGGGDRTAADVRARAEAAPVLLDRGPNASSDARVISWLMGVALIVLLVASANVANLLLARAVSRRREIAMRLALGVTRPRLFQQLLTESLLIAGLGGMAGLLVAHWGGRALRALFLQGSQAVTGSGAVLGDGRTLAFAAAATLGVALLTGLAPAVQALREDVAETLKSGARAGTYRRSRLRAGLLLFQGAMSVVLLVGAGLFVRSLSNASSVRLGYDVDPVVYVEGRTRGEELSDAEQNALLDRLVAAALSMPTVASATPVAGVPFWSFESRGAPVVAGRDSLGRLGQFRLQLGNPSYFETMGTRVLRGRGITTEDRAGSRPVMVVSQAMARALWPDGNAVGEQLRLGRAEDRPTYTVVGIAEDVRGAGLQGDPEFWYFLPVEQYRAVYGPTYLQLMVRVNGRAEDHSEALRRRLQQEMPGAAYVAAMPLGDLIAPQRRSWELGATMFTLFGALALILAAIGLYSLIAYAVAQRTHELGVRIALGAGVRQVVGMVVGQGVAIAVAGIAIGGAAALWAGRFVEPLLFSQSARDPVVFGVVAAVLLAVALLASLRPAVRATRVDPTVALRAD